MFLQNKTVNDHFYGTGKTDNYHQALPLFSPRENVPIGRPVGFTFRLSNPTTGQTSPPLEVVHTKPIHMFFIREDMAVFRHEHPTQGPNGQWQVHATLPDAGRYHVFVQYKPAGQPQQTRRTTITTVGAPQRFSSPPQVDAHLPKFIGPYEFRITSLPTRTKPESHYQLQVFRNGQPVNTIQPYLGAGGHSVITNMGAKALYHVHPMSPEKQGHYGSPLTFHTTVQGTGLHKVWVQVKLNNQVYTTDWTFNV